MHHICINFLKIAARKRPNHPDTELTQLQVSHEFKGYKITRQEQIQFPSNITQNDDNELQVPLA